MVFETSPASRSRLLTLLLINGAALLFFGCAGCSAAEGLQLKLLSPDLLADRLRQGGVPANERQAVMEHLFMQAGCAVTLQPVSKKSANVICDLPGESTETIVVGGHFDFVENGQGIVDDWSGASMLISLYQVLRPNPLKHTYRFVAFAGEERGLLGSERYVKEMKAQPNLVPQAFVKLECLGLASPKVWVTRSDPTMVRRLFGIANAMQIPLQGVNVEEIGDDDTHPFLSKKVPVICIHSLTQEKLPILHSSNDNINAVSPVYYYDAFRLVAFYLDFLDTQLPVATKPTPSH